MNSLSNMLYLITPFFAWLVAGSTKFLVNSIRTKSLALSQIGYGGFPSNHSAIVSSIAMLIALRESIQHPAFGVAMTLAFIVMMDANGLRMKIAQQAQYINQLNKDTTIAPLRERVGHSKFEILGGAIVGACCAIFLHFITQI